MGGAIDTESCDVVPALPTVPVVVIVTIVNEPGNGIPLVVVIRPPARIGTETVFAGAV
jgi:hypothetical protein